jgi:hypothetical protein
MDYPILLFVSGVKVFLKCIFIVKKGGEVGLPFGRTDRKNEQNFGVKT